MEERPVRLEILARANRLGILGESFEGVVVANVVVLQNAAFGKVDHGEQHAGLVHFLRRFGPIDI